jgi:hypothetical protein
VDAEGIIANLRENEGALMAWGVSHAAFDSRARGETRPGCDIGIFVEIEPGFPMDVFLTRIDKAATGAGQTRSGFLAGAARERIKGMGRTHR